MSHLLHNYEIWSASAHTKSYKARHSKDS